MRTFEFTIEVAGKVTIPDTVLSDLRNMAAEEPVDGGPVFLHNLHKATYESDDDFLQGALKNALRSIVRNGLVNDIGGLGAGVGYRVAPALVTVSVPERVVTKVKDRLQLVYGGTYKDGIKSHGVEGALEQADPES